MAPLGKERAVSLILTETGTSAALIAVMVKDDALLLKRGTVKV
jgi:hypothetical protein